MSESSDSWTSAARRLCPMANVITGKISQKEVKQQRDEAQSDSRLASTQREPLDRKTATSSSGKSSQKSRDNRTVSVSDIKTTSCTSIVSKHTRSDDAPVDTAASQPKAMQQTGGDAVNRRGRGEFQWPASGNRASPHRARDHGPQNNRSSSEGSQNPSGPTSSNANRKSPGGAFLYIPEQPSIEGADYVPMPMAGAQSAKQRAKQVASVFEHGNTRRLQWARRRLYYTGADDALTCLFDEAPRLSFFSTGKSTSTPPTNLRPYIPTVEDEMAEQEEEYEDWKVEKKRLSAMVWGEDEADSRQGTSARGSSRTLSSLESGQIDLDPDRRKANAQGKKRD